jgi:pimeloyl-ACP methyl ester carboxylesterase
MSTEPPNLHTVDAGGLKLHVLERGPASASVSVVMLHGWLDHAHGFDWMAEQLPKTWRLFALDFRGHGQSEQLPKGASHQFTDHVADVEALVRHFSLSGFLLVGHSLGGSVSICYAAARPARVKSLTLIESLGTSGGEPSRSVERIADFVEELFKPVRRRVYASAEEAGARVAEANSSYSPAASQHMAKYGTVAVEGGVVFRADPLLKRTSGMSFDEAQVLAFCAAVKCPVQVIQGSHAMTLDDAVMKARLSALRDPPVTMIEGGHHVHLDRPLEVAQQVERFVLSSSAA